MTRVKASKFINNSHTEELKSTFDALPKFTYSVTYYMAHCLQACVQFNTISNIKQSLKDNTSKALIVMYHNQKVLQMKYQEGQAEYLGKK